jgi:hypothetical protein
MSELVAASHRFGSVGFLDSVDSLDNAAKAGTVRLSICEIGLMGGL